MAQARLPDGVWFAVDAEMRGDVSWTDEGVEILVKRERAEAIAAKPRRKRRFKQADVTRAFRAAQAAGIHARVEIAPDGRIAIVPDSVANSEPYANPWDEVFDKLSPEIHSRLS